MISPFEFREVNSVLIQAPFLIIEKKRKKIKLFYFFVLNEFLVREEMLKIVATNVNAHNRW